MYCTSTSIKQENLQNKGTTSHYVIQCPLFGGQKYNGRVFGSPLSEVSLYVLNYLHNNTSRQLLQNEIGRKHCSVLPRDCNRLFSFSKSFSTECRIVNNNIEFAAAIRVP